MLNLTKRGIEKAVATCVAGISILMISILGIFNCISMEEKDGNDEAYAALRLHIIANSDSEEDQAVKLMVRDAVLQSVQASFAENAANDSKQAERCLLSLGSEIQKAAETTLAENGFSYGVQLISGDFDFPERDYGEKTYPAGEYSALRIILGEGEGQNWWCVMFPPLCIINDDAGEIEYNEDNGTVKFESIFADLWRKLFG